MVYFSEILLPTSGVEATTSRQSADQLSPKFNEIFAGSPTESDEPDPSKILDVATDFFSDKEIDQPWKKKAPAENRVKWNDEEETEIRTLFAKFFLKEKRPDAKAIRSRMEKSKANGGVIHLRTVSALKNKIFRMIK